MRSTIAFLFVGALASGLAAQPPAAGPRPQPVTAPDGSTVTVTGCVRASDRQGSYVLTNVTWTSPSAPAKALPAHHDAPPQPERPAPPAALPTPAREQPAPAADETLRLAGDATRLRLGDHVGHTITATGMIAPADPVVRPAVVLPDAPGDTTSRKPAEDAPGPRVLNLRSITHVANDCK